MKNPNDFFFHVFLSAEIIDQRSVIPLVQFHSQGVDGEIPSIEIHLEGTHLHLRGSSRGVVGLNAGRGHIHLETVRKNENHGSEFFMASDFDLVVFGEFLGELDAIALNDNVHIEVLPLENDIPHKAAHKIGLISHHIGYVSKRFQELDHPSGQALLEHGGHVLFSKEVCGMTGLIKKIGNDGTTHQNVQ